MTSKQKEKAGILEYMALQSYQSAKAYVEINMYTEIMFFFWYKKNKK